MKKILITGVSGYIGGFFIKNTSFKDYQVHFVYRNANVSSKLLKKFNGHELKKDNTIRDIVELIKPNIIYHFAGLTNSNDDYESCNNLIESNVIFFTDMISVAVKNNIKRVVVASTHWQNYTIGNFYTITKKFQEEILEFYSNKYKFKGISVRIPDVFGPNDSRKKIWQLIVESIKTNKLIEMTSGNQDVDLLYVKDIIEAFYLTLDLKSSKFFDRYNLTSNNIKSLRAIIKDFEDIYQSEANIIYGVKPHRYGEVLKLNIPENMLPNWQPKHDIRSAILDLINTDKK